MEEKVFSTRDIDLAASLVLSGCKIDNVIFQVEGDRGNVVGYFMFEDTPEVQELNRAFCDEELSFEPQKFSFQQKALRNRVINGGKGPHIKTGSVM